MNIIRDEIKEVIRAIDETTALFYQQKNKEGYQMLDPTLKSIMTVVNMIFTIKTEINQIQIDEQKLNTVLGNAMKAIERGDTILLSDILHFDLRNMLDNCCK